MKRLSILICSLFSVLIFTTSCSDFFEQESKEVIYSDKDHLYSAVDTVFSVVGILDKLQAIADRTNLLGEVRADLVDITDVTPSDLRDLAQFNVGDDNIYNRPFDYYAIINNCNYFIAHVDTAMKNNRDQYIFMKEWAAVKGIRAWTYLQLVLNYGRVPFVTEPVLTKEDADKPYPQYTIDQVCDYFINDLATIPERYNTEYPGLGSLSSANVPSRLLFFPLSILRGELYLWKATMTGDKESYRQAALNYYKYINERNGINSAYPIGASFIGWLPGNANWNSTIGMGMDNESESVSADAELISMIAISPEYDSVPNPHFNRLRYLYNSREDNKYKVSLEPSVGLIELSASQPNCCIDPNGLTWKYSPAGLSEHMSGDLRLSENWSIGHTIDRDTRELIETQTIRKFRSRNIHVYRRTMLYLRMAEALNMAGYPRMAFLILSNGINNNVIQNEVMPYYPTVSDSLYLARFDFANNRYGIVTANDMASLGGGRGINFPEDHNTIGIHTRGSGWTPYNEYYQFTDSVLVDSVNVAVPLATQQAYVDSLIINESALEFAFEGTRYYDMMRFAKRQPNPGAAMQQLVFGRKGEANRDMMSTEIKRPLTDERNWFLTWKGKVGF
jgi:hypothetical protein